MNAPAVSVVMSVHNGERYLREAIDSLLAQTFGDFELLVVDDASSDGTASILASYASEPRLRLLTNETNAGLTKSLNRALRAARGALIARQDADDRSRPQRLERQVAFLREHPDIVLIGTAARIIDARGRVIRCHQPHRAQTPLGARWQLLFGNPFIHSSVMFRRDAVVDRFGGYDEAYVLNQDFELWSRVVREHPACNLPDALVDYRVHDQSLGGLRGEAVMESRRQNVVRNLGVQRANMVAILGDEQLADEWPPLWTAMNVEWVTGPAETPARALGVVDRIFHRFVELHPAAARDADIAAHRRDVAWWMTRYFARRDRRACARAFLSYLHYRVWEG